MFVILGVMLDENFKGKNFKLAVKWPNSTTRFGESQIANNSIVYNIKAQLASP